ncbi:MAG: amidohydrolase [Gemmatimonadaceae bacterium]
MHRPWVSSLPLLCLLTSQLPSQLPQRAEPVVVYTGSFITLDSLNPRAEAMAVRQGRIVAIGNRRHVDSVAGPAARHAVLRGVALPGFADAHVHPAMLGEMLMALDLRAKSKAQILASVRQAAANAPSGRWIRGMGWDQSFWTPPVYPTAAELDAASAGHPVLLERIDGHAVWANTAAMKLAGITSATADPPGGTLTRDAARNPTGIFIDDAIDLIRRGLPAATQDDAERRLRAAMDRYARWGLTSIHDAGASLLDVSAYHALAAKGPLPVRAYVMASTDDSSLAATLARGVEIGLARGTFTLRTVKVVDDGALGSRGARLSAPYADDATQRGFELAGNGRLDRIIQQATARGFQVAVHAIGDASSHDVLAAFERAGPGARSSRFRLEHASMLRDEDVKTLVRLGVIASMQPVFVGEYSRFAQARLGKERLPWVLRSRDVIAAGAVYAAGTDFPASDTGDPIMTLYAMVTRRGFDGRPESGWLADQRVSVDVALRAMTIGPAYAAFEEREGGILRDGRRADVTVLSADPYRVPPAQLRTLRVLRTIVGGRTTYEAK